MSNVPGIQIESLYIETGTFTALSQEANLHSGGCENALEGDFFIDSTGTLRGKRRMKVAGPGPELVKLHEGLGLKLATKILPDVEVVPTRSAYLYYGSGDFLLLHRDIAQCWVTLLMVVEGIPDPLWVYPSLGQVTENDLKSLNAAPTQSRALFENYLHAEYGVRIQSEAIRLIKGYLTGFASRSFAHARYPAASPVTLCALCYVPLLPKLQSAFPGGEF